MSGAGKVWPLAGNQRPAVEPGESVWLSASAGTGKTQVLSARVLRLLLQPDVTPSQIMCLTFTKAGATEMAARINEVLASWVRMPDARLAADLNAIGADFGQDDLRRARTLFAAVLDCPGGGLRIDTIHAFAQWLLAAFPHEAGLVPGARPMEDRDRELLLRQVLAELLVEAEERGNAPVLDALSRLSLRMAPDEIHRFLLRCAEARALWTGPGAWQPPFRPRVNQLLGLPADADESHLHELCHDDLFDCRSLRQCLAAYSQWATKTGGEAARAISAWLEGDAPLRVGALDELAKALFTQKGDPKNLTAMVKIDPGYGDCVGRVSECLDKIRETRALLALAEWLTPALELGREFALAWDAAKQREGLIDFDDQIARAAELLCNSDLADWIRYKLDRRFDHILVDEAQDTNAAQWSIIFALADEFWSGLGARDGKLRTLFVVGDYKQAIFRFQGTSPENFRRAGDRVRALMAAAAGNAAQLRDNIAAKELQDLGLDQSFRTAQPVLDFVNAALRQIGHVSFGLSTPPEPHVGEERPGLVALWRPVSLNKEEAEEAEEAAEEGAEGWLSRPDRRLADQIARQVRAWIEDGFPLVKGEKPGEARAATAGDIMVLVRKRRELAGLIVARLHAAGVPVAGVDRLRLGAPLGVKDLLAALRFAAQPLDDLNLASLLVSPLLGWSQEDLLAHAYRPKGTPLWEHLRQSREPLVAATLEQLGSLLAIADYEPPQALLHWLLVGPWQGRRNLVARLGREVNDPLDELLNAAHAYAVSSTPSLIGFLTWFDAGEGELKREAGKSDGLVRVMTVHGAKGLQAPIVILADATGDPGGARGVTIDLPEPERQPGVSPRVVPLPGLRKDERRGRIAEAELKAAKEEGEEHWRLLYVAMTRAEEALFVAGALGTRQTEPPPGSWYARLLELFTGEDRAEDPLWGWRLEWGGLARQAPRKSAQEQSANLELPRWLTNPVGPEPRPPRPLAPSSLGDDMAADPPFPPELREQAARRGVLIHALLERLPDVAPERRPEAASAWLARSAATLPAGQREEIAAAALRVLAEPEWAELFGPGSLAEVPIAAVVAGRVIAGTIDRLLVTRDRVRLVDYKTARRAPERIDEVPLSTLRQMAAYAAALEATFPGRTVEAAILYTQAPRLIALPASILAAHKPGLTAPEESYPG